MDCQDILTFHYGCQVNHTTVQKFIGGKLWLCEGRIGLSVGTTAWGYFHKQRTQILRRRKRRNWIENMEAQMHFGSPVERQ
jgi:hypothetical protein